MRTTDTIIEAFSKSFDDRSLSSSENKGLKSLLTDNPLSRSQRDLVIARLYEMAETGLGKGDNHGVLEWLKRSNKLIMSTMQIHERRSEVHFSPGRECLAAILHEISKASRGIDICVFTISDDRISSQLINAHEAGIAVRVLTDNEKLLDAGSDIKRLAEAGLPVKVDRTRNHMHHKFAIFDSETALTGSYNWTRSAESYNNENILITDSPGVVKMYRMGFENMWSRMADF